MKEAFFKALEELSKEDFPTVEKARRIAQEALPEKIDKEELKVLLEEIDPSKIKLSYSGHLGILVSEAIGRSGPGKIELHLGDGWSGVDLMFCCLGDGYEVVAHGKFGNLLGWNLKGAKIEVHGSVGHELGAEMEKGEIVVHGDAGDHVGSYMKDGSILVEGNAGKYIGHRMSGGRVEIRGRAEESKLRYGGEVVIGH